MNMKDERRGETAEQSCAELPPAALLVQLLERMQVSAAGQALIEAYAAMAGQDTEEPLARRVAMIFNRARLRGLQPAILRWQRFDQRRLPVLVCVDGQWLLAERDKKGRIRLIDASGNEQEPEEAALSRAQVLFVHVARPEIDDASVFSTQRAGRLVLRTLFSDRAWLRDVAIATVLVNVLGLATSLFAMQVYDRVVPTLAYATLWTLLAGMGLVIVTDWLLKTIRARILDSMSCAVNNQLSQHVYDHILRLRLDLHPSSLGTLAAQVGGLDAVRQFFSSAVIFALVDMPFALMFIVFIAIIGGPVAWVYVLLLPVGILLGYTTQLRLRRLTREEMMRANERQGVLVDSIRGAETIRSANAGWRFSSIWEDITRSIGRYNLLSKAISNFSMVTTTSLSTTAYVSAIVVGVGQIGEGYLTMGGLVACSILGGRVIAPIAHSVQHLVQWQNVEQSLKLVDQVLAMETEREPGRSLVVPAGQPGKIRLEEVVFSYPGSPVKQLDVPELELRSGERVLLLGAIGSGKSTLLKVLAGLYRPGTGRVRLDGVDLWEMDLDALRQIVGYLPQNVHLFKGTLRSNLTLAGTPGDNELLEVCNLLGIDAIAAGSPKGMDREISEGGEGLSGGQKQMVGLARVMLGRPRIWLLDEPTSSLDWQSDNRVIAALESRFGPEDIVIISTHRPALLQGLANRVIVMHEGKVVEDGAPDVVLPKVMRQASGPRKAQRTPGQAIWQGGPGGGGRVI